MGSLNWEESEVLRKLGGFFGPWPSYFHLPHDSQYSARSYRAFGSTLKPRQHNPGAQQIRLYDDSNFFFL